MGLNRKRTRTPGPFGYRLVDGPGARQCPERDAALFRGSQLRSQDRGVEVIRDEQVDLLAGRERDAVHPLARQHDRATRDPLRAAS